ncbi:RNA recognition motif [Castilleja foliolosa]|uniref:RNA recognition motif n=1 Tax=Castilleja foliolosa TaxID=1961234 RepID=A0ABD3E6A6_9LAMI
METLLPSSATVAAAAAATLTYSAKHLKNFNPNFLPLAISFSTKTIPQNTLFQFSTSSSSSFVSTKTKANSTFASPTVCLGENGKRHWIVLVEPPPQQRTTKSQIIDYYVSKLERVLGKMCLMVSFGFLSEKDAQMCMYDASCDTNFGFCCDIDEKAAHELASLPGVLSVKPDPDLDFTQKDHISSKFELNTESNRPFFDGSTLLFPAGTTKRWLVRTERPAIGAVRKAQVVDYYVQVLLRVLRNEKDAQMCMYHVSWESNYGFCCELDDECARELAAIPGVLSVEQDENFGSDDKNYGVVRLAGENSRAAQDSSATSLKSNIKTKKIFVTGLSFYTSEKTLRSAFEGFGELVEVKIIMDKISKRSKGYAFVEYTTEEAASTALREMNGKIINGWMITVDVAKKNPPKYSRGQPRPTP